MTPEDLQRLFDTLGPDGWRIFSRDALDSEPWFDGISPRVVVQPKREAAYYVLEYEIIDGNTVYVSRILEPDIIRSGPPGHLLRAIRDDDDLMEFSTLTLTASMKAKLTEAFG